MTTRLLTLLKATAASLALSLTVLAPVISNASIINNSRLAEDVKREDRKVGTFNRIEVSSAIELRVRQADVSAVAVEAKVEMLPKIETEVFGNTLKIKIKGSSRFKNTGKITVYVSVKQLLGLDASGASKIIGETAFNGDKLALESSGASSIHLDLTYKGVIANISGASSLHLKGNVGSLNVDGSGASSVKAFDMIAQAANVELSGASSAGVNVSKTLVADVSGASSLRYKGRPTVSQDVSGASSVKRSNE